MLLSHVGCEAALPIAVRARWKPSECTRSISCCGHRQRLRRASPAVLRKVWSASNRTRLSRAASMSLAFIRYQAPLAADLLQNACTLLTLPLATGRELALDWWLWLEWLVWRVDAPDGRVP